MNTRDRAFLPIEVREHLESIQNQSPQIAIDYPEHVTRCVVLDAICMFYRITGRMPVKMHVPKLLEISLEVDMARSKKISGSIRRSCARAIMGCAPVWDAREFLLE